MILFFTTMVFGTLLAISSYSWFSMWIGLEINLLSIIPLFSNVKSIYPSEAALKYFITQAMASSILLFSVILLLTMNEFLPMNSILLTTLNSSLLTKMGAAPFHFWFPEVIEGLNWMNSLILLTWQKLAPLVILSYNTQLVLFISIVIIISAMVGGILGLNQLSLRKILAFSSINHLGWMLASIMISSPIWFNYFLVYSVISLNLILIFNHLNLFVLHQASSALKNSKLTKISVILNFLSLGGLPPLLGFFPKWMTLNILTENNFNFLGILMVILTLITLFFYLRICFSSLTLNNYEKIISSNETPPFSELFINMASLAGLSIGPMILFML
uniref:NADH-ubiquinone oxidoreductase chain 2 n=1 Tax=Disteniidae sp. BMNH 899837 TaxID=1903814 RepID=A0A343A4E4_9CUCU|nr:NADH dehydrogenase subunit 2 [Disteniidae sp. BMNH 899837]